MNSFPPAPCSTAAPCESSPARPRRLAAGRELFGCPRHQRVLRLRLRQPVTRTTLLAASQTRSRRHHGTLSCLWRAVPGPTAAPQRRGPADEGDDSSASRRRTVATIKDRSKPGGPGVRQRRCDSPSAASKDGIVYLTMKVSCSGCPALTATLQHGNSMNLRKHFVPTGRRSGRGDFAS